MRLICPNCSAQYEIDASLIPDEGRDVQCSNCGHTWFELPPPPEDFSETAAGSARDAMKTRPAAEHPGARPAEEPESKPSDEEDDEEPDAQSPAVQAMADASEDADEWDDDDDDVPSVAAAATSFKARRPADAAALDVLREEAEREMSHRRAPPTEAIETQADLGLEDIRKRQTPSRALRARMARGDDTDDDSSAQKDESGYKAPERDLLPDIDEINSSLKPATKKAATPEDAAAKRSGFRWGFILMVLLAIALILAYAWAPAIARAVPNLEPTLIGYVDWVNGMRDWIDGLMGGAEG